MHHQVEHSTIPLSAHTVYLCVLCGSENKQRLFHCTALTDWLVFITETECVYCAVRTECLSIIQVKFALLKRPSPKLIPKFRPRQNPLDSITISP